MTPRTAPKSVDTDRAMFSKELRLKYIEDIVPLQVGNVERRIYDIQGDLMVQVPNSSIKAVAVRPSSGNYCLILL